MLEPISGTVSVSEAEKETWLVARRNNDLSIPFVDILNYFKPSVQRMHCLFFLPPEIGHWVIESRVELLFQ